MEQLIEKIVIEGIEFQIIQKPATLYAGYKADADNEDVESSVDTYQLFQAGHKNIKNSLTPDSMLCLSINYKECNHGHNARRSLMHCQETSRMPYDKSEINRSNMEASKENHRGR